MRLYVDISSHGLGHLAQTAPILVALARQLPHLSLTVRCGLPRALLEARLPLPFRHVPEASDFGLVMKNALEVDREASLAAYRAWHADWPARVAREAERLREAAPDLVVSNASYLTLAAATRAGIPAVALGSLSWPVIVAAYLADAPGMSSCLAQMHAALAGCRAFLRLTPGLPAPLGIPEITVGLVAAPGRRLAGLGRGQGATVLVALGGLAAPRPARLPRLPDVTWLVPADWEMAGPDVVTVEAVARRQRATVSDLIHSVDAVITKTGYGTLVEAAACGTPVLLVRRPDWPEDAVLATWHAEKSRQRAISTARFLAGEFGEDLAALLAGGRAAPVPMSGVGEAVAHLRAWLGVAA